MEKAYVMRQDKIQTRQLDATWVPSWLQSGTRDKVAQYSEIKECGYDCKQQHSGRSACIDIVCGRDTYKHQVGAQKRAKEKWWSSIRLKQGWPSRLHLEQQTNRRQWYQPNCHIWVGQTEDTGETRTWILSKSRQQTLIPDIWVDIEHWYQPDRWTDGEHWYQLDRWMETLAPARQLTN